MSIKIVEIIDEKSKSIYTENILRCLPEWFGNDKALCEYITSVSKLPYWIAVNQEGHCVGFISTKIHYYHTGDIYVCGVVNGKLNSIVFGK